MATSSYHTYLCTNLTMPTFVPQAKPPHLTIPTFARTILTVPTFVPHANNRLTLPYLLLRSLTLPYLPLL